MKKTCISAVLIICILAAIPISVFSNTNGVTQENGSMEDNVMTISDSQDTENTDNLTELPDGSVESTGGTDEPNSSTDEPNGGSNEPSGSPGTQEINVVQDGNDSQDSGDSQDGDASQDGNTSVDASLPIRTETRQELINALTNGAVSGGDPNWSGTRIIEIAFNNFETVISLTAPLGVERTIILHSADGMQRDIIVNRDNRHFSIGDRVTLIIDDENLRFVGNNPNVDSITATGGGVSVTGGGTFELRAGTIQDIYHYAAVNVAAGGTFIMSGGIIRNNVAPDGGGVFVSGAGAIFEMYDGIIVENRASSVGGGGVSINNGASFEMHNGVIQNNRAVYYGGGIVVAGSNTSFTLHDGTIENNYTTIGVTENNRGGGVFIYNGASFTMYNGVIEKNSAAFGGGVSIHGNNNFNNNTRFDMYNGTIRDNTATEHGGGVSVDFRSTFDMRDGLICGNTVTRKLSDNSGGAGVRVRWSSLFNMRGGVIEDNHVNHDGRWPYGGGVAVGEGGIPDVFDSTFNMNGGTIQNNTSPRGGGVAAWDGVFNLGTGRLERGIAPNDQAQDGVVNNPTITNNKASGIAAEYTTNLDIGWGGGGGVWLYAERSAVYFAMHSGIISENETGFRGGGVFANKGDCYIRNGIIKNNKTTENDNANTGGGGIYLYARGISPRLTVIDTEISGNHSRVGGGIARGANGNDVGQINATSITISGNSVISKNTAQLGGGGIYTGVSGTGAINSASIGLNRNNMFTTQTVRFEDNRSFMDPSLGLSVAEAKMNSTTFSNVQWSGRNSANGEMDKDDSFHLFNNHDISNSQGVPVEFLTTFSVSKKLVGKYSNMLMDFGFTITFQGSDGKPLPSGSQLNYVGDNIPELSDTPASGGTLTLDSSGSATFNLKHGQTIFIEDVPLNCSVRVVEQLYEDEGYIATFVDSLYEGETIQSNDTMLLSMTDNRTITFISERFIAPPTGVAENEAGIILMLAGVLSLSALIMFFVGKLFRRKQFRG